MRSYTVMENHISSAFSEIFCFSETYTVPVTFISLYKSKRMFECLSVCTEWFRYVLNRYGSLLQFRFHIEKPEISSWVLKIFNFYSYNGFRLFLCPYLLIGWLIHVWDFNSILIGLFKLVASKLFNQYLFYLQKVFCH